MSTQLRIYTKETVYSTHQVLTPRNEKWSFERSGTCIETQRKVIEIPTFLLMKFLTLPMRIIDLSSSWKMMATILQILKTFQIKTIRATTTNRIKIKIKTNLIKSKIKRKSSNKIRNERKSRNKSSNKRNKRRRKKSQFKKKTMRNLKRESRRSPPMKILHCYNENLQKWEMKKLTFNKS